MRNRNGVIVTVKKRIAPIRIIFQDRLRDLTYVHPKFLCDEFDIHLTEGRRLSRVRLKHLHPNCDPKTRELCLPHSLEDKKADKSLIGHLTVILETFNLDDCYYQPWKDITYS
ncbi:hypothetical protein KAR91_53860 [Candidatus Pacearchaeota archaeon]|nr:hypothetical protein [Candidatus Pacearchaeota archaeon]